MFQPHYGQFAYLDKFSLTFISSRSHIIFKIDVLLQSFQEQLSLQSTSAYVLSTITTLTFQRVLGNLRTMNNFNFFNVFQWQSGGIRYGRSQLLLLLQSGFKQLLSASLTDKYHQSLCQFTSAFYFSSLFVDRKKTMESVHYKSRRLLVAVLNTYFFDSLTDKFHQHLEQFAYKLYFCSPLAARTL